MENKIKNNLTKISNKAFQQLRRIFSNKIEEEETANGGNYYRVVGADADELQEIFDKQLLEETKIGNNPDEYSLIIDFMKSHSNFLLDLIVFEDENETQPSYIYERLYSKKAVMDKTLLELRELFENLFAEEIRLEKNGIVVVSWTPNENYLETERKLFEQFKDFILGE